MRFGGVFNISLLTQRQYVVVAPLLFCWVMVMHQIVGVCVSTITILMLGAIITVYQQFTAFIEDIQDGFFDHCRLNGLTILAYAFAKALACIALTVVPMALALLVFEQNLVQSILICFQWAVLSVCVSCALSISKHLNPLNILLGWLPVLTAPFLFLVNFLSEPNENTLFIFIGCDTIIISSIFVLFTVSKNLSVKNVFSGS